MEVIIVILNTMVINIMLMLLIHEIMVMNA